MDSDDDMVVSVRADTSAFRRDLQDATRLADGFGRALSRAFEGAILRGNSLGDVMGTLAMRLSRLALDAAFRPLEQGIAGALSGVFGAVTPFARGGIVGGPVAFPMPGRGVGIAGEAGPEAILPLKRGADGRLGVAAGEGAAPVAVTFNVTTPDARSFIASQSQIGAMLARATQRGRRNM